MNEYDYVFEDDPRLGILYDIQTFADKNMHFNTSFVDGCEEHLLKHGRISIKQFGILQEMHDRIRSLK
jgi:hypothetical protein